MARTRCRVDHGELVDRWVENDKIDPDASTNTVTGNIFNAHAGAGGVLVNDSGRVIFDTSTGTPIVVNGPHQALFGEFDDACAVLEPPVG